MDVQFNAGFGSLGGGYISLTVSKAILYTVWICINAWELGSLVPSKLADSLIVVIWLPNESLNTSIFLGSLSKYSNRPELRSKSEP